MIAIKRSLGANQKETDEKKIVVNKNNDDKKEPGSGAIANPM